MAKTADKQQPKSSGKQPKSKRAPKPTLSREERERLRAEQRAQRLAERNGTQLEEEVTPADDEFELPPPAEEALPSAVDDFELPPPAPDMEVEDGPITESASAPALTEEVERPVDDGVGEPELVLKLEEDDGVQPEPPVTPIASMEREKEQPLTESVEPTNDSEDEENDLPQVKPAKVGLSLTSKQKRQPKQRDEQEDVSEPVEETKKAKPKKGKDKQPKQKQSRIKEKSVRQKKSKVEKKAADIVAVEDTLDAVYGDVTVKGGGDSFSLLFLFGFSAAVVSLVGVGFIFCDMFAPLLNLIGG